MDARLEIPPCDSAAAFGLAERLGVSFPLAQILVRRGFDDPAAFLAAGERHDARQFTGIEDAVALLLRHARGDSLVTVHGDYDVDGICSTAILVRALRSVGASVDWFLPSRAEDGYGLQVATVERLAARGTRLIVTADCAITAVDAVARAAELGVDVVVTDHHSPRADGALPDAPIVHPAVCGYPCVDLCAAGVAYKLATLLIGSEADADLDLVALATVADCVPLLGENRRLVREGLAALAATPKPGLRALMRVARVDAGTLDARAIGFRLAPRLNAAGRMQRADTGLELGLTEDEERARQIAEELDALNVDRRHTEERIRFAAEAQVAELGEQPAYVLAGDDWHPGVIGIVASRIAERHHRPTVLIALDGEEGTGSGRSIPAFDLLGGLDASAAHLLRHGGHRAAAGCTIRRDQVEAFRAAFCAHAAAALSPEDLIPRERVDAVVAGDELGVALAEELAQLAPFGIGNPQPVLYVPAARLSDPQPMGEGKHLRFTVESGGVRARAVAFGTTRLPQGDAVDATFGLELNAWNGSVEPRLVLRRAQPPAPAPLRLLEPVDWPDAFAVELAAPLAAWPTSDSSWGHTNHELSLVARDRRGGGAAGVIAALVATGEPVLVLVADVAARHDALAQRVGGFALASWRALERGLDVGATHVVALDPPPHESLLSAATVLAWGDSELQFSLNVHEHLHALREPLAAAYRALRDGDGALARLPSHSGKPMHPVLAARVLRVLDELGLVEFDGERAPVVAGAARRDLHDSATFRAAEARLAEGRRWLSQSSPARAA
ncbi:MAG TPA: single-stranded-DNA-specific exonuclease RecJ [Solirubrobacteraceae bacterium]